MASRSLASSRVRCASPRVVPSPRIPARTSPPPDPIPPIHDSSQGASHTPKDIEDRPIVRKTPPDRAGFFADPFSYRGDPASPKNVGRAWRRVGRPACGPRMVGTSGGVVDRACSRYTDGEGESANRRARRRLPDALCRIGWRADEIALGHLALLIGDLHDPPTGKDVIELVSRVGMGIDEPATVPGELAHELQE